MEYDGNFFEVEAAPINSKDDSFDLSFNIEGSKSKATAVFCDNTINLFTQEGSFVFDVPLPKFTKSTSSGGSSSDAAIAPMPGVVDKVNVSEGQQVKEG